jgi:hypothetical protein
LARPRFVPPPPGYCSINDAARRLTGRTREEVEEAIDYGLVQTTTFDRPQIAVKLSDVLSIFGPSSEGGMS